VVTTYSKEAIEIAKAEGLHLVKLELYGKHAKRDTVSFAGPVGPETAAMAEALLLRLLDVKKRME